MVICPICPIFSIIVQLVHHLSFVTPSPFTFYIVLCVKTI